MEPGLGNSSVTESHNTNEERRESSEWKMGGGKKGMLRENTENGGGIEAEKGEWKMGKGKGAGREKAW